MKFALVDGVKAQPRPKMEGVCACCGARVISKCGDIKIWHWAHYSKRNCDVWWENETEWHRSWKGSFPEEWQEIVHRADDGEKHIADVKTGHECVIEFQHSFLNNEERQSRNNFYPNLVWVVDGLRRKRDKDQFFKTLESGVQMIQNPLLAKIYSDECRLVEEWKGRHAPVFFDFGEDERLWWLLPFKQDGWVFVVPFSRQNFIDAHLGKDDMNFVAFLNNCIKQYADFFKEKREYEKRQQIAAANIAFANRRTGFQRHLARRRARRRF